MAKPPRKCIFCGHTGVSKEHLFADWLADIFPRDAQSRRRSVYTQWLDESGPHTPAEKRGLEEGHLGSKKLRVVCQGCNAGWLSRLEERAKPILIPLIAGNRFNLTTEAQALLSTWAAKTAMVAEHLRATENGTSQDERAALMSTDIPPANWFVWIAAYWGERWRDLSIGQIRVASNPTPVSKPSRARYYGHATTFTVGHILFCVVNGSDPNFPRHFGRFEVEGLIQLWPARARSILWPPQLVCGDADADAIANIFKWSNVFNHAFDPGTNWAFTL